MDRRIDAARQHSIAQPQSKKKQRELIAEWLEVLPLDQVPERLGGCEPRAIKSRPKPFARLNKHDRLFTGISRSKYRKCNPSNTRGQSKCRSGLASLFYGFGVAGLMGVFLL